MLYILFLLFHSSGFSLSLNSILRAESPFELEQILKRENQQSFLEKMCQKEKARQKIPVSCYQMGLSPDALCLSLELSDLNSLAEIEKAKGSKSLSVKCSEYLKKKEEILRYRKKDFLLPELKNYFTDKKTFL